MKTLIIIPILLFSLFLGLPSYSSDFDKGLTAYKNGDYATALKEWKPLAEQGDADAQTNLGLMYQMDGEFPKMIKKQFTGINLLLNRDMQMHRIIWQIVTITGKVLLKILFMHICGKIFLLQMDMNQQKKS